MEANKKQTILEKIQAFLLGKEEENTELQEVKLETQKLKDGTVIQYEAWEAGAAVFVAPSEEGAEPVALPKGRYELEDGKFLVIEEDGIIAGVEEAAAEQEETQEEMSELEKLQAELESFKTENENLKALLAEAQTALEKETEESKEEETEENTETTELSAEEQETEDITSQRQEEVKKPLYNLSRKVNSTTSRVYEIINGNK